MKRWVFVVISTLLLAGCNQQTASQTAQPQDAEVVLPEVAPQGEQTTPETATHLAATAESSEPSMTKDLKSIPATQQGSSDLLKQRYAEIKTMIGDAKASDVQQCRKVAFGYKACGGPASYLIYSVQGMDEALLLQKVSEYNALAKAEAQRLGLMSDCAMVLEPSVVLVEGVCKAGPTGDFQLR